jgi:hypothetical protein
MKIEDIEQKLEGRKIEGPIRINSAEVITEPEKMVRGHLSLLRANPKNPAFRPYFDRLEFLANSLH